jgi:hypothetical protein
LLRLACACDIEQRGGGRGFFARFESRKIGAFAANGAKRRRR